MSYLHRLVLEGYPVLNSAKSYSSIEIEQFDDRIEVHIKAETTLDEVFSALEYLDTQPLLPRLCILDDQLQLNAEAFASLGKHARTQNFQFKVAVVAASDLAYGLARLHFVYRTDDDSNYSLHRNYQDALDWIKQSGD